MEVVIFSFGHLIGKFMAFGSDKLLVYEMIFIRFTSKEVF